MERIEDIGGVVLCGGRSVRFGKDKRFYPVFGRSLYEVICEKVKKVFTHCYLSVDGEFPREREIEGFVTVPDRYPSIGPLGGILSVLELSFLKGSLFVPVDMPFLKEDLLIYLSRFSENDIVTVEWEGKIYPIPGFYSRKVIPFLHDRVVSGDFSLYRLIHAYPGQKYIVSSGELKRIGIGDKEMKNMNREEDFKEIFP
jgi:molybdopterin-guanine dinucleotide biosynthesis protein A